MISKTQSIGIALLMLGVMTGSAMAADSPACKLLTPAELEPVAGKLRAFTPMGGLPETNICTSSSTAGTRVMLRLAMRKAGGDSPEAKGIEAAKKMGAIVDVKTSGPITCSTIIPPKNLQAYGFNTTCTVVKTGQVAGVEVTVKAQKDMVPIDKLRPLAEKMTGRF